MIYMLLSSPEITTEETFKRKYDRIQKKLQEKEKMSKYETISDIFLLFILLSFIGIMILISLLDISKSVQSVMIIFFTAIPIFIWFLTIGWIRKKTPTMSSVDELFCYSYQISNNLRDYSESDDNECLEDAIEALGKMENKLASLLKSAKIEDIPLLRHSLDFSLVSEVKSLLESRVRGVLESGEDILVLQDAFDNLVWFFYDDRYSDYLKNVLGSLRSLVEKGYETEKLTIAESIMNHVESENVLVSFFSIILILAPIFVVIYVVLDTFTDVPSSYLITTIIVIPFLAATGLVGAVRSRK